MFEGLSRGLFLNKGVLLTKNIFSRNLRHLMLSGGCFLISGTAMCCAELKKRLNEKQTMFVTFEGQSSKREYYVD